MRSIWTPSLAPLCPFVPATNAAHPSPVGFLAVQGNATGGLLVERPRNTKLEVRTQGRAIGFYGTSVPVVQGSGMTDVSAQAATKASGVPPRGRPV
ncbi:MAG TPA: hypothetical protein VKB69_00085 [Micromonosporaceae bacterium]|nr:hypothetical protein [Micromonosporaceae bacterium]